MTLKLKQFVSISKEWIKTYFQNLSLENIHYTKMASVAILSIVIPMSVLPVIADQKKDEFQSKIAFDKNVKVISVKSKQASIVPGESSVQIESRQAIEAAKVAQAARNAEIASASKKVATHSMQYSDPASFDGIYQSAGATYGIDWRILKAIHYVETGCSGSTSKRNPSGAIGPMQFIPSTWRAYGVDGNGDGVKDIKNVEDAIYAAANYLRASGGASNGYKTALWSYNPSSRYFIRVIGVAKRLGF